MQISIKIFEDFSAPELYALLRLRAEIFIIEQECVYQDLDNYDQEAIHLCGYLTGELVAYTRLLKPGIKYQGASLGRVATKSSARRRGYGKAIVKQAISTSKNTWPAFPITISAQEYLKDFYADLGFKKISGPYLEDNMPHIKMTL